MKKEEIEKQIKDLETIKMVTYKELKEKYIDSFESKKESWNGQSELNSNSSEIKLLNTPELVEMYINTWGISNNIKEIIMEGLLK